MISNPLSGCLTFLSRASTSFSFGEKGDDADVENDDDREEGGEEEEIENDEFRADGATDGDSDDAREKDDFDNPRDDTDAAEVKKEVKCLLDWEAINALARFWVTWPTERASVLDTDEDGRPNMTKVPYLEIGI